MFTGVVKGARHDHLVWQSLPSGLVQVQRYAMRLMLRMPVQDAAEQEQADRLEPLPAQLLNNAAVLHMRGGEPHAALALIEEAVQV